MGTTSCCSLSKNTDTNTHSRARARSNNLISTYFEIGTLQIKYKKKIVVEKNNKTIDHTFFSYFLKFQKSFFLLSCLYTYQYAFLRKRDGNFYLYNKVYTPCFSVLVLNACNKNSQRKDCTRDVYNMHTHVDLSRHRDFCSIMVFFSFS